MVRASALALFVLPASAAFADGHAIGLKVGALGLGAEYTYQLSERFSVRGALYGSELGFDGEESGIDYDFDVVWDSLSAGVDFHPMKSPLRLSVGLLKNDNALELTSRLSGNVEVGDTTYTPAEVGTLTGAIGFDDTATYAGLGWDWSRKRQSFGMSLDIGLLDQGDPLVSLQGNGTLLGDPAFQQDIDDEEAELIDSASDLDLVPYLTVGFQFRF
jgi:hypothetical protein